MIPSLALPDSSHSCHTFDILGEVWGLGTRTVRQSNARSQGISVPRQSMRKVVKSKFWLYEDGQTERSLGKIHFEL